MFNEEDVCFTEGSVLESGMAGPLSDWMMGNSKDLGKRVVA